MLYCGADVHSSSTVLHVLDGGGREVLQTSLATKEMPLMEFFLGLPKHARVFLEAGTQSAWFSRVVEATGHRAVVVDPNRNRLIAESVKKTDRNDAAALAALGRAGLLSQVWVRQERTEELRRLVGARAALVNVRATLVKVVRAQVRSQGERLKHANTERFADFILDGFWTLPEEVLPSVEPLAQVIRTVSGTIDEVAQYLGLHPLTVRRLARHGQIPAIKIGRQWRVKRALLDRWIVEKTMQNVDISPG